jgi:hypothetical protein
MASNELTISDVAERTGLTRHTLRYYERDGLMLGVGRDGSDIVATQNATSAGLS